MKAMKQLVTMLCMMGLCAGFTACSDDEEEIHQSEYSCEFKLIMHFQASSSSGDLKPDKTYENQVLEGIHQISAKHRMKKSVTYTGNDYATFDAEALALLEPAMAEMQAWQDEMHALKYEKDHRGAKFTYVYQYIVKRDSVTLKESDEITFSYSRNSLRNQKDYFADNIYYFGCKEGMMYNPDPSIENRIHIDLTSGVEAIGLTGNELGIDKQEVVFYNPSNKVADVGVGFSIGEAQWNDGVVRPTLGVILEADFMKEGIFEYGQWHAWVKGTHNGLPFAMMVPFDVVEPTSDFI